MILLASITAVETLSPIQLKEWVKAMKTNKTIETKEDQFTIVHSESLDIDHKTVLNHYDLYLRFNKIIEITL